MATIKRDKNGRILFTKEMKKDYTILVPDMLPIHFNIMRHVFANAGYKIELLDTAHPEIKQQGLKYPQQCDNDYRKDRKIDVKLQREKRSLLSIYPIPFLKKIFHTLSESVRSRQSDILRRARSR